jgi:iron complex transport system ATP-binding protein
LVRLEVARLSCKYNSVEVLREITLRINSADFVGILGPNGAGKTTLIRAISRALKPVDGYVLMDGADVYSLSPKKISRNIAVVPQDISIPFDFRSLDVVLMGRNPHLGFLETEGDKDLAVAEKAMRLVNCWELADRPINQLSGGERRKVLIARSLCQEPEILLLDEPTLHLDICNQIETMELLKFLAKEKRIAIMAVLHDLTLAARYCNSLIMMKEGRIFAAGSVTDVLTKENIKTVFRVNADLKTDDQTGSLRVDPKSLIEESSFMRVQA